MRQFYIVLAMLFALSTGLILPNQQETLRSKRSLIGGIIGGNGNAGGGIGGSIGIGGGGGIGGIIGGAGDIAGGIINGIAGVLQGLGEMAGGLAGSIGDISGNIGAIAQGGININAQAQLSLSLSVVNSQCDNTVKLINQLPASLTQAQLAKVNSVVVVLVKLRASLVAARQRVVSISADKNAQLIGEIDVSIGKVDSTIATIKNKVPSVTVPTQVDEGSTSNDGGNESSGSVDIGSIIAGAGSAGLDTSVIQQIATSIKIIVQSSSDIAASGSASADTQQKLTAALSNLDSLLGQVSVQANQISTPVSQAEAIKIKIAIALAAKVRGALVLTSEKLGSSAQNGNAVASVQGLIKKVDDIHVVLVGKLSASAGSSGSGQGEIDGGDKPSSDDLAQSITLAIKAILASANDISNSGNGGSADAKVKLSAALNALRALLDRVSQQANQIPTPVSQADAVRIKVATGLLLKLRGVLVGVRERITSSPDAAGENAESIATIDALIKQIDEIIVTLKGKVSANGNSGDENGSGNGGVNTIVQVKTALREILEAGKAIAAGNASEENNNQITEGISKINVILEDVAVQVDGISSPPSPADALKIKLTNVLLGKIKGALTLTGNILVAAPNAPENVDIISQLSKTINRVGEIQATLANKVNGGAAVDNGNSDGKNDDLCGTVSVTNAVKTAILLNKISILAQQIPNNPSVVQIGKAQAAIATLTAIRASLVAQLQQSVGESKSENSIKLFGALIGQVDATLGTLRAKVPSGSIGISALPAIAGAASISAVPDLLQQSVNSLSASIQVSTKN